MTTGSDRIAVGWQFCHVMLSDGLTAKQANGSPRLDPGLTAAVNAGTTHR
ncbi:MAG TPA: hypothetical protein VFB74_02815 [Kribbellaceae bacterium]|nr:hypothetical protein [Kribbellaceae bacterium]